jgi:PTH1 family peptidyl-tRNA hydrolase
MRQIVGLGNPGREYHLTPHNLGFLTVDRIAEQADVRVSRPRAERKWVLESSPEKK